MKKQEKLNKQAHKEYEKAKKSGINARHLEMQTPETRKRMEANARRAERGRRR